MMETVNIREMLQRNGWYFKESIENTELRKQVEDLKQEFEFCENKFFQQREVYAKVFVIADGQYDLLNEKLEMYKAQQKRKDDENNEISDMLKRWEQETEELRRKYNEQENMIKDSKKRIALLKKPTSSLLSLRSRNQVRHITITDFKGPKMALLTHIPTPPTRPKTTTKRFAPNLGSPQITTKPLKFIPTPPKWQKAKVHRRGLNRVLQNSTRIADKEVNSSVCSQE